MHDGAYWAHRAPPACPTHEPEQQSALVVQAASASEQPQVPPAVHRPEQHVEALAQEAPMAWQAAAEMHTPDAVSQRVPAPHPLQAASVPQRQRPVATSQVSPWWHSASLRQAGAQRPCAGALGFAAQALPGGQPLAERRSHASPQATYDLPLASVPSTQVLPGPQLAVAQVLPAAMGRHWPRG